MRRLLLCVLSLAVVGLAVVVTLAPPARTRLTLAADARVVRGAIHVHTTLSDGAGTPDEVAQGASRAGLEFVVLTDHGDGTRLPTPPRYVDGVLLIDAVEISTTGGHYIALGLGQAPYRLAGEPRDVIEDVTRLGGFGIAAHPDSPKSALAWREWQAPFDALEWLNADSAWRDEPRSVLARAVATYWLRRPEVIASLLDRPATTMARWDALTRRRAVVGMAGHDAHARMGPRGDWEPGDGGYQARVPSYEATFRAFSLSLELSTALQPTRRRTRRRRRARRRARGPCHHRDRCAGRTRPDCLHRDTRRWTDADGRRGPAWHRRVAVGVTAARSARRGAALAERRRRSGAIDQWATHARPRCAVAARRLSCRGHLARCARHTAGALDCREPHPCGLPAAARQPAVAASRPLGAAGPHGALERGAAPGLGHAVDRHRSDADQHGADTDLAAGWWRARRTVRRHCGAAAEELFPRRRPRVLHRPKRRADAHLRPTPSVGKRRAMAAIGGDIAIAP